MPIFTIRVVRVVVVVIMRLEVSVRVPFDEANICG